MLSISSCPEFCGLVKGYSELFTKQQNFRGVANDGVCTR